jgi:hypothetical protein
MISFWRRRTSGHVAFLAELNCDLPSIYVVFVVRQTLAAYRVLVEWSRALGGTADHRFPTAFGRLSCGHAPPVPGDHQAVLVRKDPWQWKPGRNGPSTRS